MNEFIDWALGTKEHSLDEQSTKLWRAVADKFGDVNYATMDKMHYWIVNNGNFEDHVILTDGECNYWVNYTIQDDEIVFSDTMTKVKQVWIPDVEVENAV
jgi:hypothetical protein